MLWVDRVYKSKSRFGTDRGSSLSNCLQFLSIHLQIIYHYHSYDIYLNHFRLSRKTKISWFTLNMEKYCRTFLIHEAFNFIYLGLLSLISIYQTLVTPTDDELVLSTKILLGYYFIDTIWVYILPKSVNSKNWSIILVHHILTFCSVNIANSAESRVYLPRMMLIEISTWLCVIRRALGKRYFIIELIFYLSWFLVRFFIYPMLSLQFLTNFRGASIGFQVMTITMCVLCVLNVKLSRDLLKRENVIRKWCCFMITLRICSALQFF